MTYLNATSNSIVDNGEFFSTGRPKLTVRFYRYDNIAGKILISTHDAMRLISKKGKAYVVCSITPINDQPWQDPNTKSTLQAIRAQRETNPSPSSTATQTSSSSSSSAAQSDAQDSNSAQPDRAAPSIIDIRGPVSLLTCVGCHTRSTRQRAFITCTECQGHEFVWSCACVSPAAEFKQGRTQVEADELPAETSQPNPPAQQRPKRNVASQKHWTVQVKYEPPLQTFMHYHHVDCEAPIVSTQVSIEFANAYRMKQAPCCTALWTNNV